MNKVFLAVRGIGDRLFSEGMDEIAYMVANLGWHTEVFNHYQGSALRKRLESLREPYKLVVAGHSMGVDTADDAVTAWGGRVDGFLSVDSAYPETLPENVEEIRSITAEHFGRFNVKGGQRVVNVVINGTTHTTVDNADELKDLAVDLLAAVEKGGTMAKPFYIGKGEQLTEEAIVQLAAQHGIPAYLALACAYKETPNLIGSWSSGALNALYEDHVAWRNSSGTTRDRLARAQLAAKGWRDLPYPKSPYPDIDKCALIAGEEVAALSTSWGLYQILGENHRSLGFPNALSMVKWLAESEANQFIGWVRFIDTNGLRKPLLAENYDEYARRYNGPAYRQNQYAVKLRQLAEKFKRKYGIGFVEIPVVPSTPGSPSPTPPKEPGVTPTEVEAMPTDILVQALANSTAEIERHSVALERVAAELKRRIAAAQATAERVNAATAAQKQETEMKDGFKKWWQSLGVNGGLTSLVSMLLVLTGYDASVEEVADLGNKLVELVGIVGAVLSMYGRMRATKEIG